MFSLLWYIFRALMDVLTGRIKEGREYRFLRLRARIEPRGSRTGWSVEDPTYSDPGLVGRIRRSDPVTQGCCAPRAGD